MEFCFMQVLKKNAYENANNSVNSVQNIRTSSRKQNDDFLPKNLQKWVNVFTKSEKNCEKEK
jgi:hypothetical protein